MAAMNAPSTFSLHREIEAAKVIREQLADILTGDPDFLADTLEGETSLFEQMAALAASVEEDRALVEGMKSLVESIGARKKRIEARIDLKRTMIASAMEIAEKRKLETPAGTITLRDVPPKVIVQEEAEIPTRFWKPADPKLDLKELGAQLKAREAALAEAAKAETPEERDCAVRGVNLAFPAIPGATLSNGSRTIQIR